MPVATSTPKLVPRAAALSASAAISAAASVSPSATAAAQGTKPIISEQARRLVIAYYFVRSWTPRTTCAGTLLSAGPSAPPYAS